MITTMKSIGLFVLLCLIFSSVSAEETKSMEISTPEQDGQQPTEEQTNEEEPMTWSFLADSDSFKDHKKLFAADNCEQEDSTHLICGHPFRTTGVYGMNKRQRPNNIPVMTSTWAISDKYRFAYQHVLKCGGTTTFNWLQRALCGDGFCNSDMYRIGTIGGDDTKGYFRWTFARNVFSRAVSVYAMAEYSSNVSFEDFWTDSNRWQSAGAHPDHGEPQSKFLLDRDGFLAIDYVAHLERANEEMGKLVKIIGSPEMAKYYNENGFHGHGESYGHQYLATRHLSNYDALIDGQTRPILMSEYKTDIDLLQPESPWAFVSVNSTKSERGF